jgi:hypothetical protein
MATTEETGIRKGGKPKIHSSAGYGLCVHFAALLSTQSPPADAVGLPGGYPLDPALSSASGSLLDSCLYGINWLHRPGSQRF